MPVEWTLSQTKIGYSDSAFYQWIDFHLHKYSRHSSHIIEILVDENDPTKNTVPARLFWQGFYQLPPRNSYEILDLMIIISTKDTVSAKCFLSVFISLASTYTYSGNDSSVYIIIFEWEWSQIKTLSLFNVRLFWQWSYQWPIIPYP
jgi:hypothetical protein